MSPDTKTHEEDLLSGLCLPSPEAVSRWPLDRASREAEDRAQPADSLLSWTLSSPP